MLRCSVSLLLIAGLLATPLAAIPHAHAGMSEAEQRKHDAAPHVHSHSHQHGHHDHGAGKPDSGNRGHHHEGDERSYGDDDSKPAGIFGERDHSDDAIFLCLQPLALEVRGGVEQITSPSPFASLVALIESRIVGWPPPRMEPPWQTPEAIKDGSEIYLTLLNLRI